MARASPFDLPGALLHLGEPIKIYRLDGFSRIIFVTRLLAWLVVVVSIGYLYLYLERDVGWVEIQEQIGRYLLIIAAALGLIGLVSVPVVRNLYPCLLQWNDVAIEYSSGIAYRHRGEWRALKWEEIIEVTRKKRSVSGGGNELDLVFIPLMWLLAGYARRYTIRAVESEPIQIGGALSLVEDLMDTIEKRTHHRLERATADLIDGEDVLFGPVAVNLRRGICRDGNWHTWDTVRVAIDYVSIEPPGFLSSEIKTMKGDVPNGDVLLALADRWRDWISADEMKTEEP